MLKYSFGASVKTNDIENVETNYQALVNLCSKFVSVKNKTDLPYFCGGQYSDNIRHTESLISRTLIVLDIDKYDGNIDTLAESLKNTIGKYKYICYSTWRHTPEKPRIRIILFPSQEIVLRHYRSVIEFLAIILPCSIDTCSYSASYAFFASGFDPSSPYTPFFYENEGELVDIESIISGRDEMSQTDSTVRSNRTVGDISSPVEKSILDMNFKKIIGLTNEEIKDYLARYTPESLDYQTWVNTGMAINHETSGSLTGRILWENWSRANFKTDSKGKPYTDADYVNDTKEKWKTFDITHPNVITFRGIKSSVDKNGGKKVTTKIDQNKYIDFPDLTEKGNKQETLNNVAALLEFYGISASSNVISKTMNILAKKDFGHFRNADNDNNKITAIYSLCQANDFKIKKNILDNFIQTIAFNNQYNPITDFIESISWDGVSRLQDFYDTVPSDFSMKNLLLRKWLIAAVEAAYTTTGISCKGILVFQGGQSIGKTSWFRRLLPKNMKNYLAEGFMLDPRCKDSLMMSNQFWVCELGELNYMLKHSDINAVKNHTTRTFDIFRRPFDRHSSTFPRKTIFFGSVEDKAFLVDDQNLRFWTIAIKEGELLDINHKIDMQQLWAEVKTLHAAGESWDLTIEEGKQLELNNKKHKQFNAIDETTMLILDNYDFSAPEKAFRQYTVTEMYKQIYPSNNNAPLKNSELRKWGKVLENLGIKQNDNGKWKLPPRRLASGDSISAH